MSTSLDMLFRRVAVEHRILTTEQAEQARHAQNEQSADPPLPVVMVELGLLSHGQVAQTLKEHRETFGDVDPAIASRIFSWALAAHVVEQQLIDGEKVNLALREIGRREASRQSTPFLGDLLLSQKVIARDRLVAAMKQIGLPISRPTPAASARPATAPAAGTAPSRAVSGRPPTGKALVPRRSPSPVAAGAPKRPTGAVPRPVVPRAPAGGRTAQPATRPRTARPAGAPAVPAAAQTAPSRSLFARLFGWLFRPFRKS